MPIDLKCPSCGKKLRLPESAIGKKSRCPGCSKVIRFTDGTSKKKSTSSPDENPPQRKLRKKKRSAEGTPRKPKVDASDSAWDAFAAAASPAEEDEYTLPADEEHPLLPADNEYALPSGDEYLDAEQNSLDTFAPYGAAESALPPPILKKKSNRSSSTRNEKMPPASFWAVLMGTSRAAKLPADAIHKYPSLARYLGIVEVVTRVCFVIGLIVINGYLLLGAIAVIGGASLADNLAWYEKGMGVPLAMMLFILVAVLWSGLLWLVFISSMAALEFIRVVINIEDNTSR